MLASGSAGNCTLLETEQTRLLVDAGLGKKETLRRLAEVERKVDRLDGIVISHEHTDHIGGLAQVLGQWRTTVYITETTLTEVKRLLPQSSHKRLDRVEHIRAGKRFRVGDIDVSPFSIPHDAADPLAFTFCANGMKVSIVTDLGYLPELVKHHLRDSDCLVLESNHDLEMLKVGPYPWHVKQRVMSRTGHLSNHTVSEYLADAEGFDARARYLILAHLSQNNNNPHVARISALEALGRRRGPAAFCGELLIAAQRTPLATLEL
jgi:phosphoribosyl 1,2-cyclic phosphodiesterase